MATNTVSNLYFDTTFVKRTETSTTPKVTFAVASQTSFPVNGISAANSYFYFKVTDYNGDVVYQNPAFNGTPDYTTPDVIGSAPSTFLNTSSNALVINADGSIITGEYTIQILQRDNSQSVTDLYTRSVTKNYDYHTPESNIDVEIDIFTPLLTLSDSTSYTVLDPKDNTPLNPTKSYAGKYYPPSVLELSAQTFTSMSFNTNNFYEDENSYKITVRLSYEYQTDTTDCSFFVSDVMVATDSFDVIANALTEYYCCLKAVEDRYWEAKCSSGTNLATAREDFETVMSYATLVTTAVKNGSYSDVEMYIARMKEIAKCTDECDCSGDDDLPRQITGIGNPTITNKITETADGSTTVFPTAAADKNKLIGKSYTNGEFIVFIDGVELGSSSTVHSFDSSTGEMTLTGYTPSNGVKVVFNILK